MGNQQSGGGQSGQPSDSDPAVASSSSSSSEEAAPHTTTSSSSRPQQTFETRTTTVQEDEDTAEGEGSGMSQSQQRKLSYWELAKYGYQELVNAIIRPPRAEYEMEHLGPDYFEWHGRCFQRVDLELINPRGQRLACSHWMPVERSSTPRPCLIYLHGNASARVEGISQLALCLSVGITLFAFDFSGSGMSEGEWVSLGYWERDDLATVIAHLRATGTVSTIALWGRSMGAVCALLHGARDPSIAAMICDGAFADLTQLAEELVDKAKQNGLAVPGFVVSIAIRMIRASVLKTAKFKLEDVAPVKEVHASFVPALFVAGEHDDFVAAHHSKAIHAKYAGDKNLVLVEGDHNSPRPRFLFDSAAIFLQTCMDVPSAWTLPGADAFNAGAPPWLADAGALGLNLADLGLEYLSAAGNGAGYYSSSSNGPPGDDDHGPPLPPSDDDDDRDADRPAYEGDYQHHHSLGMTTERQLQVQQTLANVLGGSLARGPPPDATTTGGGGGGGASSRSSSSSRRRGQSARSSTSSSSRRASTYRMPLGDAPAFDELDRPDHGGDVGGDVFFPIEHEEKADGGSGSVEEVATAAVVVATGSSSSSSSSAAAAPPPPRVPAPPSSSSSAAAAMPAATTTRSSSASGSAAGATGGPSSSASSGAASHGLPR